MEITRNNYEQYFLDFAEGRLAKHLLVELEQFLLLNPDLKTELEAFEKIPLTTDPGQNFNFKSELKKEIRPSGNINATNYINYLVAELEGDLSADETNKLSDFISANPVIKREQKIITKARLIPDKKIIYDRKAILKKSVIIRLTWQRTAAALAIAASLLLVIYFSFKKEENLNNAPIVTQQEKVNKPEVNDTRMAEEKSEVIPGVEKNENLVADRAKNKEKFIRNKKVDTLHPGKVVAPNTNNEVEPEQNFTLPANNQLLPAKENEETAIPLAQNKPQDKNETPGIIEKHPDSGKLVNEENGLSVKQYLAYRFRKGILKEKSADKKKKEKLSPIDLAMAAINGAGRFFGSKIKMNKNYHDSGELASVSISSPSFEITRPMNGGNHR